jgi:hypothetical protein
MKAVFSAIAGLVLIENWLARDHCFPFHARRGNGIFRIRPFAGGFVYNIGSSENSKYQHWFHLVVSGGNRAPDAILKCLPKRAGKLSY